METIITQQAKRNFMTEVEDDTTTLSEEQGVLGIEGIFEGIDITATGYRSLASLLLYFDYVEPAKETCQKAIDCQVALEKVRAAELMAQICLQHDPQVAYAEILMCYEAMYDETIPESLRRSICTTKAKIEAKMKMIELSAASYELARSVDPNSLTTGDILDEEVELFSNEVGKQKLLEVLKKWNPLERLTWLCWRYDDLEDKRSRLLRDVAVESGEAAFIIQMYLESIKYLENVNAAAPLKIDLALAYQHVKGDLEAARQVLDEVLDSGSTGWPAVTQCHAIPRNWSPK
ncbi:uncharacterized protein ColSpa_01653 [Colletotrichum spaethianum]|uniref:Uncharacterized protein n=1 Tax=Colletotrichum spaethianum TaxID=700344 RepID=A0AA37LBV1_9PEZI|nr:uncharacterized protein ColSpa_01653 [Colletotrichum spaethianum]GKT41472.1 hypothetical protein ColSpa_01653 [Colletotrichum spaethianum]